MSETSLSAPSLRGSISRRSNSIRQSFTSASRRLSTTSPRGSEPSLAGLSLSSTCHSTASIGTLTSNINAVTFVFSKQVPKVRLPKSVGQKNVPVENVLIPTELLTGIVLDRVTHKKRRERVVSINRQLLEISWDPKKSSSRFTIDDMISMYCGSQACPYQNELGKNLTPTDVSRWITIVYLYEKKKIRELHMISKSDQEFMALKKTIQSLWSLRKSCESLIRLPKSILENEWMCLNVNCLTFDQVVGLLNWHNIILPPEYLKKLHQEVNQNKEIVTFADFFHLTRLLGKREEVDKVYDKVTGGDVLTFEKFTEFCLQKQKMSSDTNFEQLFEKYSDGNFISKKDFCNFLMSEEDNELIQQRQVEMDEPLTQYFISSSHNTYLPNRQVLDDSSVEPYIKQLLSNCRCVEIDVWDGDNIPMVGHHVYVSGSVHMLMTKEIKLTTVLLAINEFAFETSGMPVILSFEIRCNLDNQRRVAKALIEIFGDKLVAKELGEDIPLLGQLQNKILVKVKAATESTTVCPIPEKGKFKKSKVIAKELGCLGVYLVGTKFKSFESLISQIPNHCFSFSETKINRLINLGKEEEDSFVSHNKKYFTRVYPDKTRVRSTNFDPIPYWKRGVQLVALNWQTYDLHTQFNEAMFAGTQGFIKKPRGLEKIRETRQIEIEVLSLWNLPGSFDSSSKDYSVSIEMYGLNEKKEMLKSHYFSSILSKASNETVSKHQKVWTMKKMKTSEENALVQVPVNYNYNNYETYTNSYNKFTSGEVKQKDWEFMFLRFIVKAEDRTTAVDEEDDDEEVIGQYIVKADSLNEGYRHVPLKDHESELEYKHARIFVNIKKK